MYYIAERQEMIKTRSKKSSRWEYIYQTQGVVQKEPILAVKKLPEVLLNNNSKLRILDVGCGTGRHIFYLADQLSGAKIIGIDNSPSALKLAKNVLVELNLTGRVRLLKIDIDQDISQLGKFDIIIATLVIHHGYSKDITKRIQKLSSLLKPGGLFVFSAPSTKDPRFRTGYRAEAKMKIGTAQEDGDLPHHFFDKEELLKFFTGYKLIYTTHINRAMVMAHGTADNLEAIFQKVL